MGKYEGYSFRAVGQRPDGGGTVRGDGLANVSGSTYSGGKILYINCSRRYHYMVFHTVMSFHNIYPSATVGVPLKYLQASPNKNFFIGFLKCVLSPKGCNHYRKCINK
jgi:hypothetical protein